MSGTEFISALTSGSGIADGSIDGADLSANALTTIAASSALTTAYAPVGRTIHVENYRTGAGMTDQAVITAAFAALGSRGALKFQQNRTYVMSTAVAYDLTTKPNVLIDGQGAVIDGTAFSSGSILQLKGGTTSITTTLAVPLTSRSTTLTVASTSGITAGQMLRIRSDAEIFNPDRSTCVKQEMARVLAVPDGVTLVLEERTWNTYSISGYTVTVTAFTPVKGLRIGDLTIQGLPGGSHTGLQVVNFDAATIDCVTVLDSGIEGIAGSTGIDMTVRSSRVQRSNASGVGYGFHVVQAQDLKFIGCTGRGNRHSFDVDEARDVLYQGCTATADLSAGLSTHGSTELVKFLGNTVKDCGGGLVSRGKNAIIRDNIILGSKTVSETTESYTHGITLGDDGSHTWGVGLAGMGLILENNRIDISGPDYSAVASYGIYCTAALVDASIRGNYIAGYSSHGIYGKGDYAQGVQIRGNRLIGSSQVGTYGSTASYGIFLSPSHGASGNTIKDAEITENRVTYALHSGIRVRGDSTGVSGVSDDIVIRDNIIGDCGIARVHISDGFYGSHVEVVRNEWRGLAGGILPVSLNVPANYLVFPYVNSNGFGTNGPRLLGEGQQSGAKLRTGLYYGPAYSQTGTAAVTQSQLKAIPMFLDRQVLLDRIALNVTTAGTTGSVFRLGIYADVADGVGGYPGALVSGSEVTVAADAVAFALATINVRLAPGLYWLAAVAQGGAPSATLITASASPTVGYQGSASIAGRISYAASSVTGALPSTFSTSVDSQGAAPLVQVRIG